MVKIILIKSPDEWATTKQACRDELVVYLCFSFHIIYFALLWCIEHCFTKYIYTQGHLVNALLSIRVIYITGVITLIWFHNSLRKPRLFLDKHCFNPSLRSANKFFHLCLISTLAYPVLVELLGNTSTLFMISFLTLILFVPKWNIGPQVARAT